MPAERLLHYREYNARLPGHPEKGHTPGVEFSSGRLGHMWAFANGVAMANPGKVIDAGLGRLVRWKATMPRRHAWRSRRG
jgi:transketolase